MTSYADQLGLPVIAATHVTGFMAAGALCLSLIYYFNNVKNIYVPLTSRCNSLTLPQTRGPGFVLPAHVVAALCRVRDLEAGSEQWKHWCIWLEMQESYQKLPPALEAVSELPSLRDGERRPSIADLLADFDAYQSNHGSPESIVFGGEGEPTLRWEDLERIVPSLLDRCDKSVSPPLIRVTTNGLTDSGNLATRLQACGVSSVSVALMTNDAEQYDRLMHPITKNDNPHGDVVDFISSSVRAGLDVEVTGVQNPSIDEEQTQALVSSLGVTLPMRWRPFFAR